LLKVKEYMRKGQQIDATFNANNQETFVRDYVDHIICKIT